jgi:hypothetical protein
LVPTLTDLRLFAALFCATRNRLPTACLNSTRVATVQRQGSTSRHCLFHTRVQSARYDSGLLDISAAYPDWDPSRHYLVTVLTRFSRRYFTPRRLPRWPTRSQDVATDGCRSLCYLMDACARIQRQVFVNDPIVRAVFTEEELGHRV